MLRYLSGYVDWSLNHSLIQLTICVYYFPMAFDSSQWKVD